MRSEILAMERLKVDILLCIYNRLIKGKVVSKKDIVDKFNISERTFYRYIRDVKKFVQKPDSELVDEEIISDRSKGGYILKGKS